MDAFKGVSGTFDREAYSFALSRSKQTEADFESNVRRDITRSLMRGMVAGGFAAPES